MGAPISLNFLEMTVKAERLSVYCLLLLFCASTLNRKLFLDNFTFALVTKEW